MGNIGRYLSKNSVITRFYWTDCLWARKNGRLLVNLDKAKCSKVIVKDIEVVAFLVGATKTSGG